MQSNKSIMIVVLSVVVIGLLTLLFSALMPTIHNWNETLEVDAKEQQPYDLGLLYNLLQSYSPDHQFKEIKTSFTDELPISEKNSSYVFLGKKIYLKKDEVDYLMDYVGKGNTAFILADEFPQLLMDNFISIDNISEANKEDIWEEELPESDEDYSEEEERTESYEDYSDEEIIVEEEVWEVGDDESGQDENIDAYRERLAERALERYPWDGTLTLADSVGRYNYTHPKLKGSTDYSYKHTAKGKIKERYWEYFNGENLAGIEHATIGLLNGEYKNFIRIPYEKGFIYLHCSPYAFTNFHLLNEDKLEYAGRVFSHLPEGDIYWDWKSAKYAKNSDLAEGARNGANGSSLKYILSQPSLRWAWYLLIGMLFLYILFRAKREQRIIPVLAKNTNSSLQFINTIGLLYFFKNDHQKLAKRKMQLFLAYVRDRYLIPTTKVDREMKERLSTKAQVHMDIIEEIFLRFQRIDRATDVSEDYLINFHKSLEQFYQTCK